MNRNAYTRILFLILIIIKISEINAQISQGGTPLSIADKIPLSAPTQDIPQPDWAKINEEDKGAFGNFRFAVPIDVNFDTDNSGVWTELPSGGRLWQLKLRSKNALQLAIAFADFDLPEGSKLFFYSPDYQQVRGAFNASNNSSSHRFLAPFVRGEEVVIEYFEPEKTAKSKSLFRINKVYHAYPNSKLGVTSFGESYACEINVNCAQGSAWQTPKKGVVRILVVVDGGMGWCSGSLVNNTKQDGAPYILSAYHCDDGFTPDHALWTFYFHYESPDCNNPTAEPIAPSIQGCVVRAASSPTDFQLLEMSQRVPTNFNAHYNGWNRDSTNLTAKNTMIHHPEGDIKKISLDNDAPTVSTVETVWNGATRVVSPARSHIRSVFDEGGMEPGSSGAPIFDANGRIIAQLHGGNYNNCQVFQALSGWFAKSWDGGGTPQTRLKDWLDPLNSAVLTLGGVNTPIQTGATVAGKVRFWNGTPMANVKIYLGSDSTTTNNTGDFSFSNIATNIDLTTRLSKVDSYENGVDAADILLIRRHILSIIEFNSPYKSFSGDVNGNNDVDAADILLIRRLILGIIPSFSTTTPWRFVTVKTSTDPNFPFGTADPSPLTVRFTGSISNFDFYGFKKGDVNGSAE